MTHDSSPSVGMPIVPMVTDASKHHMYMLHSGTKSATKNVSEKLATHSQCIDIQTVGWDIKSKQSENQMQISGL